MKVQYNSITGDPAMNRGALPIKNPAAAATGLPDPQPAQPDRFRKSPYHIYKLHCNT
jgi:hypothetical protein